MKSVVKIFSFFILIGAVAVAYYWMSHKPKLHPKHRVKRALKQVHYCPLEPQRALFRKNLFFRVLAYEQVEIKPRVSSKVVWVNPKLYSYSVIKKGETLFKLDKSDFLLELQAAKKALAQAKLQLQQELKRAERAKVELLLVKRALTRQQRDFLLRKPFLEAARAEVEAAKADVKRAELALKRCTITAPFALQAKSLLSGLGDVVSPSKGLAEVVRVDKVVAEAPIEPRYMAFIDKNATLSYKGFEGSYLGHSLWVDEETQEGFVRFLFTNLLPIGAFLQGSVQGKTVDGVVAIPKEAIGLDGAVWSLEKGRLRKRVLECLWEYEGVKFCKSEKLNLVKSVQPYFFDGMRVKGVLACD